MLLHLSLDLELVISLQVFKGESPEDAVPEDQSQEPNVREEEGEGSPDCSETPGQEGGLLLLLLSRDGAGAL